MSVTATVTDVKGQQTQIIQRDFAELAAWMEAHYGEFVRIEAKLVSNKKLRQGR